MVAGQPFYQSRNTGDPGPKCLSCLARYAASDTGGQINKRQNKLKTFFSWEGDSLPWGKGGLSSLVCKIHVGDDSNEFAIFVSRVCHMPPRLWLLYAAVALFASAALSSLAHAVVMRPLYSDGEAETPQVKPASRLSGLTAALVQGHCLFLVTLAGVRGFARGLGLALVVWSSCTLCLYWASFLFWTYFVNLFWIWWSSLLWRSLIWQKCCGQMWRLSGNDLKINLRKCTFSLHQFRVWDLGLRPT